MAELATQGAQIVSGHFDPLLSSFAEGLAAIKQNHPEAPLVVLIRSSQHPILPARDRAELVAALAVVDHVVDYVADYVVDHVCDAETSINPAHRLETEHERKLRDLMTQVHGRQAARSQESQF